MEASNGGTGERGVTDSPEDLGDSACGPVLLREAELLLSVLLLLGGESLYSGVLGSSSTLSLAESLTTLLPLGVRAEFQGWPYRVGGCQLRVFFRILLAVLRVFVPVELPPHVDDRLWAMISVLVIWGWVSQLGVIVDWLFDLFQVQVWGQTTKNARCGK